jgi:hypothetical protein
VPFYAQSYLVLYSNTVHFKEMNKIYVDKPQCKIQNCYEVNGCPGQKVGQRKIKVFHCVVPVNSIEKYADWQITLKWKWYQCVRFCIWDFLLPGPSPSIHTYKMYGSIVVFHITIQQLARGNLQEKENCRLTQDANKRTVLYYLCSFVFLGDRRSYLWYSGKTK